MLKRLSLGFVLGFGISLVAACNSAEERAEEHFQTALEHIADGDVDRAIVEFRNVFKLNGQHQEARLTFARLQRERGAISEAYGQYLRLVEQYPENLEGRRALAELAIETGNWEEVERHGKAAAEIAPDDPVVRATLAALDYRAAIQNKDDAALQATFEKAKALLTEKPDLIAAHQIVIDYQMREQDWSGARDALDDAISTTPDMLQLYTLRLGVLNELGDTAAIKTQFQNMLDRFPENENIHSMLLSWYMSQGDTDAAEAFLRDQVDPENDNPDDQVALVRFLAETKGPAAARSELDRIIAEYDKHDTVFRTLRAALIFESGDTDAAITEIEQVLENADTSSAETNNARVVLARMLFSTGNAVGARAEVEETLAADPSHVDAQKIKARWLIDDDRTGDAIAILREALGQSPRDPELMTLLARAHDRSGNRDLMADMLALAVEASGSAPAESLRYATFLARDGKELSAEDILLDALRLQPENLELLGALGNLYIQMQDWGRAQGVIDRLNRLENGASLATRLNVHKLTAQGQEDTLISFLEDVARKEGVPGANVEIIRSFIRREDLAGALDHVDQVLQERPDDMAMQFVRGSILAMSSRFDEATAVYRSLLDEYPETEKIWITLYRLESSLGNTDEAAQILDDALEALPASAELRWAKAGELEKNGDISGAISIYEALYEDNSNGAIVANNLASLLATHRDDAETLDRAWRIARRLRNSKIPAFQDTYGWIAYRRGNLEDALTHLELAAEGLPDDPQVQYHLAATYAALEDTSKALEQFKKVAAMSGNDVIIDKVNAEIARLTASAEQAGEAN